MVRRAIAGILTVAWALPQAAAGVAKPPPVYIQFIFTSDAHYGLTRPAFRGASNVDAHTVNAAMMRSINGVGVARFPHDRGLRAGETVGPIDFLVEGGDVANRSEEIGTSAIQSAAVSWAQFKTDYVDGLRLTDRTGARTAVYVVPGNHDASNAVGFYKPMRPLVDKTSMVEIYNLMMAPWVRHTTVTYDYRTSPVLTSRDIGGVHLVFLTVWPDSNARAWLSHDLARIDAFTPVLIFTHDQPDAEAKHFVNPNGDHSINDVDKFENLLTDVLADGSTTDLPSTAEQSAWEDFVRAHGNIAAYFHGNSNWNEFYDWHGPRRTIALHSFRVDSPMKGARSSKDETKLSFQVATIDAGAKTLTVRECFWNAGQPTSAPRLAWGSMTTVKLRSSRGIRPLS